MRYLDNLDNFLNHIDNALRTIIPPKHRTPARENPGSAHPEPILSGDEKKNIAGLMRVNHTGEVCAQALYQGQALTAKLTHIREQMEKAAKEEVDHLAWCEQRLQELNSQPSILNPLWYSSAFLLGLLAGFAGDKWSLGFVAETEHQVSAHLERHLQQLSKSDQRSTAILTQMHIDESEHAKTANEAGAAELPWFIKDLMSRVSKLMTNSSYYI